MSAHLDKDELYVLLQDNALADLIWAEIEGLRLQLKSVESAIQVRAIIAEAEVERLQGLLAKTQANRRTQRKRAQRANKKLRTSLISNEQVKP